MTLTRLLAPATLPVTTEQMADHLRLPTAAPEVAQTDELTALIRTATTAIERRIDGALIAQGWLWRIAAQCRIRDLPLAPVISVDSIALVAPDGTSTPWTGWHLEPGPLRPRLAIAPGRRGLPIPSGGHAEIRFTAGFGPEPADIPDDLRHAVQLLAAHYYENREAASHPLAALPLGVATLIAAHRPIRI